MSIPLQQFVECLADSGLMSASEISAFQEALPQSDQPRDAEQFARTLIQRQKLTKYQASMLLQARTKGLVLGNYAVLDKIGQGGMGMVFKARHRRMDRVVAIKVLPPTWMKSERTVQRFHQEVKALAKLTHPNIVTAFDADEAGGVHFLVMEFVEGRELLHVVKDRGPLPVAEGISYILQAARGLDYAHKKGVVHRDVKPANLLLSSEGVVKILDMGLARLRGESAEQAGPAGDSTTPLPGVTQAGIIIGTPEYLAPEQADDARKADHRADIYSLGCSLFFLLTGKVPFAGQTAVEKVMAHRDHAIPSLRDSRPEIPAWLDSVLQRMLAKRPEDRYQSLTDAIGEIEQFSNGLAKASQSAQGTAAAPLAYSNRRPNSEASADQITENQGTQASPFVPTVTQYRPWLIGIGIVTLAAAIFAGYTIFNRSPAISELARVGATGTTEPKAEPADLSDGNSVVAFPREQGFVLNRDSSASAPPAPTPPVPAEGEIEAPPPPQPPPRGSDQPAEVPARPKVSANIEPGAAPPAPRPLDSPANPDGSAATKPPDEPATKPSIKSHPRPQVPTGPDPTYQVYQQLKNQSDADSFEKSVREILEQGWATKASGLKSAEEHFKTAHKLLPSDPRADYAIGLVLLKHNRYDDALEHFDLVAKEADPPYLPAYRAATWLRVLRKAYEPAALDLVGINRACLETKPKPLPTWVHEEFVAWTGRMMGYLEGPIHSRSLDALCEKASAEIGGLLTPELGELFKAAKEELLDSYAANAGAQEQARLAAKRDQEKAAEVAKARITQESEQTKEDRKQVQKTAEELEKALREQLGQIDAQIMSLSRDYDQLDTRARAISRTVRSLESEIASLIAQKNAAIAENESSSTPPPPPSKTSPPSKSSPPTKTSPPPKTPAQNNALIITLGIAIDQKNRERTNYQSQFDRLELQARDVQRQGVTLTSRRQTLINDFQSATGLLFKEKESLAAKEKFLDREKQKASKPATGNTTQVRVLGQTATALKTYIDLNLELEKQRVLESFEKP